MTDMQRMMQQAQVLQRKMEKVQKDLENKIVTAELNGIVMEMTGKMDIKHVHIPASYLPNATEEELERLGKDIEECFTKLKAEVEEHVQAQMQEATGGIEGLGNLLGG